MRLSLPCQVPAPSVLARFAFRLPSTVEEGRAKFDNATCWCGWYRVRYLCTPLAGFRDNVGLSAQALEDQDRPPFAACAVLCDSLTSSAGHRGHPIGLVPHGASLSL